MTRNLKTMGEIAWGKTCEILLAAYHDGQGIGDTLEWRGLVNGSQITLDA